MTIEEQIAMFESSRERMHRLIDERYDSMIHCIRTGQSLRQAEKECYALSDPSFLFKGKKPHSIIFPNGDRITVNTWREVAAELLRDCNSDPNRHEALMQLRYMVSGNSRWVLTDTDQCLDVAIKVDEGLYFEGKFDTEYLLKMLTERIFEKVGYPYEMIEIEIREKGQSMASAEGAEESMSIQML